MNPFFRRSVLFALGTVLLSVLAHFRWFDGFHTLASGDWLMNFPEETAHLLGGPSAWRFVALGSFNLNAAFHFMEFFQAVIQHSGFSYGVAERVVYLWPIAVLTPLGAFLLARKVVRSDVGAAIGALAYWTNVYFLTKQQSHVYIMLANALAPFAVLACMRAVERRRVRDTAIAALALFALSAADFRIFYIVTAVAVGYGAWAFLGARAWKSRSMAVSIAAHCFAPVLLVLAMNSYWLLGAAFSSSLAQNAILDRGLFGNHLVTTGDAVALWRGEWTDTVPKPFGVQVPAYRAWWLPLAALAGTWLFRRDRRVVFFWLVAMLGVFLGKQVAAPFGDAYRWLFANFPGFSAFRESSKFYVLTAIGYSIAVAALAAWLASEEAVRRLGLALRAGLVTALVCLPLLNVVPLLTGEMRSLFEPYRLRPEYAAFADTLRADPSFSRVLWLPTEQQEVFESPLHPRLDVTQAFGGRRARAFLNARRPDAPLADDAGWFTALRSPAAGELLDVLSVRYVAFALPRRDGSDSFDDRDAGRSDVRALFERMGLSRLDLGHDELVVYENPDFHPHFSVAPGVELPADGSALRAAHAENVSITRHELRVDDVRGPFILTFTDAYHDGWTLAPLSDGWHHDLRAKGRPLPGVEHVVGTIGLNYYRIDPSVACTWMSCETADDGSVNMRFALRFWPQAWFDLGFVITLALLTSCLAVAVWPRKSKPVL